MSIIGSKGYLIGMAAPGRERGRERESEKYIDDGYDVDDNGNGKAEQQQQ